MPSLPGASAVFGSKRAELENPRGAYTIIAPSQMELIDLYLKGKRSFEKGGFESPGTEARALLSKSLGADVLEVYSRPRRPVGAAAREGFERLLLRRLGGEPLSYVTGRREFCSRTFAVSPDVLIPRPETETLAEVCAEAAGRMREPRVLDLGTGSGCLAVTVSLEAPGCRMFASDASAPALAVARRNALEHGARARFVRADMLGAFAKSSFDVIISNPPYVSEAEYAELPPGIREHEPALALLGGPDGLGPTRRIAAEAGRVLREGGLALVETADGRAREVGEIFRARGFGEVEFFSDPGGARRVVKTTWKR